MTLLLSTAYDLYWLGRYMQRAIRMQSRMFIERTASPQIIAHALGLEKRLPEGELKEILRHETLPEFFEKINDNVQTVRGVIDQDAYELFMMITRLRETGTTRAACFQLQACHIAMQAQEPQVSLFWRLGDVIEMLDDHIRFGDSNPGHFHQLAQVATGLPAGAAWDDMKQPAQAMVFNLDVAQFRSWMHRLHELFEDGV